MGAADQQPLQGKSEAPPKRFCTQYCVYKFLVLLYGLLFFVIGLILLGVGLWVVLVKQDYESINDVLTSPAILCIVVGVIILLTAMCGLIGALREKLLPLKIFLGIVIIVFILQVVLGIIAFIYRTEMITMANKNLRFAIEKYTDEDSVRDAVNAVQIEHMCCGLDGPADWDINKNYSCNVNNTESPTYCSVPSSCCRLGEDSPPTCGLGLRNNKTISLSAVIFKEGCGFKFLEWTERHLDTVGAIALGFAILHLLGIFIIYLFITKVEDRILLFKYRKRVYADD